MKSLKYLFFLPILHLYFSCSPIRHKAVFIIIDGVPADVVEKTPTPVIDEISSLGGYNRSYVGGEKGTYSESPTISAVGYNHLLTGTWTNKHNVWGNGIEKPNYHYWNIFRIAETVNPGLKTAVFSTWLDNRTKLIGEGLPEAGNIKLDYAFDGFENDTLKFPHSNDNYIFKIDEHVSKETARYILENGPDLSWVYLEYTDDIGHQYGDGPEMTRSVETADIQIGRVWNAVKERMQHTGEKWMVVVTTDHGRSPVDGKDHGGQSERERTTWIATNAENLNSHFKQNPAMVDILPSILRYLNIEIPETVLEEADGVPFTGRISISDLQASRLESKKIELSWRVVDPEGEADIFVTSTNHFKDGQTDQYQKVGRVKVKDAKFIIDIINPNAGYYKILVKAPYNMVNKWVIE